MTIIGRLFNKFKKEMAKSQSSYYGKLYNSYNINYEVDFALSAIESMREKKSHYTRYWSEPGRVQFYFG